MNKRKIGNDYVGEIGLGCMGMTHGYGPSNEKENIEVLEKALEIGCNFWDTADYYSAGGNEVLLSNALKNHRNEVFLSTKVGNVFESLKQPNIDSKKAVDGSPSYIKREIENSLKRLKTDHIDLYYLHRVDPLVPIEETIGAMSELVTEGKVRYIGLSEASADTIKRANIVHSITALQSEYSIWYRDLEKEILPLCDQLGIVLVPFAPLGRGFLTGNIYHKADLSANDWRKKFPRFQDDALAKNKHIVDTIQAIAKNHNCAPATIALSWLLTKKNYLIPIPGTRHVKYLLENVSSSSHLLTEYDMNNLSNIHTYGSRFPSDMENLINK